MAGNAVIDRASLKEAVIRFCDDKKPYAYSIVGDGERKDQFRLMCNGNPEETDLFLWEENGKPKCVNVGGDPQLDFLLNFMEYLKPVESPRKATSQSDKAIMPRTGRSSLTGLPMASGSTLTLEKVRDYFCKTATDEECAFALEVCSIRGLNPFKGDCHLVKYEGKNPKLEILVANSFLLKKAMGNQDFKYFKAGVTVQKEDGSIENVIREYAYPGETLLGGWAEMARKSIEVPFRVEIPLAGNKKESKWWVATPGHMIRKTASSQVSREAFPDELGGLYDVDELGIDPSKEVRA